MRHRSLAGGTSRHHWWRSPGDPSNSYRIALRTKYNFATIIHHHFIREMAEGDPMRRFQSYPKILLLTLLFLLLASVLAACAQPGSEGPAAGDGRLQVVATTTIVGDVVSQVGGEQIDVHVLLPVGADPHSFDPTPQDIAKVADADLVFANGAGLESFLDPLIESAGAADRMVKVSEGIELRQLSGGTTEADHNDSEDHDQQSGLDPHTWTDPNNVMVWVENIQQALSKQDPANAESYAANASAYTAELKSLDTWIREQVAQVPQDRRMIVTDHTLLGYFADEYGFTQVGALIPGYSTLAEPTAKDLADIEDAIRNQSVPAVFVGNTVNPALAERVAQDTGVRLVYFYTGSLTAPGGDAGTYLEYMRYNVGVIVAALKE
jgi:ABC-type Zn uptake system ZnuABC Zn-binding protein ZnuA